MKMTTARNDRVLRPDFARRVVERVRKAKRRRQLYRWALTSAFACALMTRNFFYADSQLVSAAINPPGTP